MRKRDVARGRIDLGQLGADRAKDLLERYHGLILTIVRDFDRLDFDDLVAVGRVAVLEAVSSHNEQIISEYKWVRQIIHWRVKKEALRRHGVSKKELTNTDPEPMSNGAYDQERAVTALAAIRAMRVLTHREHAVVDCVIRGDSFEDVARKLGVSKQRAHRHYKRAIEKLRTELGVVLQ